MVWSVRMKRSSEWSILLPLPREWDGNGGRKAWKSEGVFESAVSAAETAPLAWSGF